RLPELPQHVLELLGRALERRVLVGPADDGQRLVVRAVDEERKSELLLRVEAAEADTDRNRNLLLPCEFHACPTPNPSAHSKQIACHASSCAQPPASLSARTSSSLPILLRPGTPSAFARS